MTSSVSKFFLLRQSDEKLSDFDASNRSRLPEEQDVDSTCGAFQFVYQHDDDVPGVWAISCSDQILSVKRTGTGPVAAASSLGPGKSQCKIMWWISTMMGWQLHQLLGSDLNSSRLSRHQDVTRCDGRVSSIFFIALDRSWLTPNMTDWWRFKRII